MDKKSAGIKSLGFDIFISAVYFAVLLLSFVLLSSSFQNGGNTKDTFVSCLVLVIPCCLDCFKDIILSFSGQKSLDIINTVLCGILFIIALLLLIKICSGWNNKIMDAILIYSSSLSFLKYVINIVYLSIDLYKKKYNKEGK